MGTGGVDIPLPEIIRFDVSPAAGAKCPFKIPSLKRVAQLPKDPFDLGYPYKIAKVGLSVPASDRDVYFSSIHSCHFCFPLLWLKVRDLTLEEITVIGPSGSYSPLCGLVI